MISINWRYLFFGSMRPSTCLAATIAICLFGSIFIAAGSFWLGARISLPSDFLVRQDAAHQKLEKYFQANTGQPEKFKNWIYSMEQSTFSSELMQSSLAKTFMAAGLANSAISLLLFFCLIMMLLRKTAPL